MSIYAVDLKFFRVIDNLEDCRKFQSDLNNLCNYCINNYVSLMSKKVSLLVLLKIVIKLLSTTLEMAKIFNQNKMYEILE